MIEDVIGKHIFEKFKKRYYVYEESLNIIDGIVFFLIRSGTKKTLILVTPDCFFDNSDYYKKEFFEFDKDIYSIYFFETEYKNLKIIWRLLPDFKTAVCNKNSSFGTGDRLGLVTAAHISAFKGKDVFPVLAQQSERELKYTGRSWEDVIASAFWGCLEAGFFGKFGADADHLKSIDVLERTSRLEFSMFTIDSSYYIKKFTKPGCPNSLFKEIEKYYLKKQYKIKDEKRVFSSKLLTILNHKYSDAINFIRKCYVFLKKRKKEFDFEVTFDETDEPTNLYEHIYIVEELRRLGVTFTGLALRFIGKWEKSIDFVGDLDHLKKNMEKHLAVRDLFGGYRLSLHSGSDKYSVYPIIRQLFNGNFHIKTSGVSWLHSMMTIAEKQPELFREIFAFILNNFAQDRVIYPIYINKECILPLSKVEDNDLPGYFINPDSRKLLHISFGEILNAKNKNDDYLFRDEIYRTLLENEIAHYNSVRDIIENHLKYIV